MKHMNKTKFSFPPTIVLFSSCLMLNLACHCNHQDSIELEIRNVMMDTIPPHAIITDTLQIDKNTTRVLGRWEFQSSEDWKEYTEWVTKNLAGQYELIARDENSLTFRRSLTGDIYNLQIQNSSINPHHVRVTFDARPN